MLLLSHPSLFSPTNLCLNAASPSSFVLHHHVFYLPSFRKAPHSPSPSIAPLSSFLHSFTPHPPSVVSLVPLLIQLSVCGSQHCFLQQNTFTYSFIAHCASPSPRAAPRQKKNKNPPRAALAVMYLFIAWQLICQLVALNCLRIYNLAWCRAPCV